MAGRKSCLVVKAFASDTMAAGSLPVQQLPLFPGVNSLLLHLQQHNTSISHV